MSVSEKTLYFIELIKKDDLESIKEYVLNTEIDNLNYLDELGNEKTGNILDVLLEHMHFFDTANYKSSASLRITNKKTTMFYELLKIIKEKGFSTKGKNRDLLSTLVERSIGHGIIKVLDVVENELFLTSSEKEKINILEILIAMTNDTKFLKAGLSKIDNMTKNYSSLLFTALNENLYINNFDHLITNYDCLDLNHKNKDGISIFEKLCLVFGFKSFERNENDLNINYLEKIYLEKDVQINIDFLNKYRNNFKKDVEMFLTEKVLLKEKYKINNIVNKENQTIENKKRL